MTSFLERWEKTIYSLVSPTNQGKLAKKLAHFSWLVDVLFDRHWPIWSIVLFLKTNKNINRHHLPICISCVRVCFFTKGGKDKENPSITSEWLKKVPVCSPLLNWFPRKSHNLCCVCRVCVFSDEKRRGVQVSLYEKPRWLDCQLVESWTCCNTARISFASSSLPRYLSIVNDVEESFILSVLKPCSNISFVCHASRSVQSLTDSMSHPKQSIRDVLLYCFLSFSLSVSILVWFQRIVVCCVTLSTNKKIKYHQQYAQTHENDFNASRPGHRTDWKNDEY